MDHGILVRGKKGRKDYAGTNLQYPSCEEVTKNFRERWSVEVYIESLNKLVGLGVVSHSRDDLRETIVGCRYKCRSVGE